MAEPERITIDGNEAAVRVAYRLSDVCAIYPITPASPMGEWADAWAAAGRLNLWGDVPEVVEMQSEGGAAGALHGAVQTGALASTFTASQGLLLMIPDLYKIAGELTPMVFHVAARSLAVQALSIFGDHSDVMSARMTGLAMLCSGSVQEAQDLALIAHASSLAGRLPVLHFFDGFRTSHEVAKISALSDAVIRELIDDDWVQAQRRRALSPERPVLRGSSQNPDVYFQGRETVNPFYAAFPGIVQQQMDRFAALTGRHYRLFDYEGDPQARQVLVIMGSGGETVAETVDWLVRRGRPVGVLRVRLYRPFSAEALLAALPETVERIAVLDRTKEPGADGEPLYKDVVTALARAANGRPLPRVIGGRYGLSSKEFTPAMVCALFDHLAGEALRDGFTLGIHDDVMHSSIDWDPGLRTDAQEGVFQAVFYGLGADGTVSANKNAIKIIGEAGDLHVQGYFVYDSKKSGAVTVSHLRFGPRPIRSAYLIEDGGARFVACHQAVFVDRYDMLVKAAPGAVFLVNMPGAAEAVWDRLPLEMQQQIIDKGIRLYAVDAYRIARETGLGERINTIMQTCFFALTDVLPRERAIAAIKDAVERTYGRKGQRIIERNFHAIDQALAHLQEIPVPGAPTTSRRRPPVVRPDAPEFVRRFTAELIAGRGDQVPVSAMPADGTFPLGTAAWEKRRLAHEIPVWEPDLCTHCGKCPLVCPHGVIRSKLFPAALAAQAPPGFKSVPVKGRDYPQDHHICYQVAPEDCTGCGLCVDICPIRDKSDASRKALNMAPVEPLRDQEIRNWDFFLTLPEYDRRQIRRGTIKGAMILQPLFEFSGACSGCGETPYIKLATQLFGDRMIVANATGCSSIYGGNLPTTPWTRNREGRGPAWNNSLFEDNAEFGLGMRIAIDRQAAYARRLLERLRPRLDGELVEGLLNAEQDEEAGIQAQRERVGALRRALAAIDRPEARELDAVADRLIRHSVWIIGGDGWAYDIGYGGLDHVLAAGRDVNILVLDTEVYSNTGGQTSKATPRGAVAKFSAAGKDTPRKDLARLAMDHEHVYVAQVAYGAKDTQTIRAFLEAESWSGPSLILAYSPCIAHGVDLAFNHRQQRLAVDSGHWPLFRFDPRRAAAGDNPLHLDSPPPSIPYREFARTETRFSLLERTHPERAARLLDAAQREVRERYHHYEQLAHLAWQESDGEEASHG